MDVWRYPLVELRFTKIFNLRSNPFELDMDVAIGLARPTADRMFVMQAAMAYITTKLSPLKKYPRRQALENWIFGGLMETIRKTAGKH